MVTIPTTLRRSGKTWWGLWIGWKWNGSIADWNTPVGHANSIPTRRSTRSFCRSSTGTRPCLTCCICRADVSSPRPAGVREARFSAILSVQQSGWPREDQQSPVRAEKESLLTMTGAGRPDGCDDFRPFRCGRGRPGGWMRVSLGGSCPLPVQRSLCLYVAMAPCPSAAVSFRPSAITTPVRRAAWRRRGWPLQGVPVGSRGAGHGWCRAGAPRREGVSSWPP